MSEGKKEERRKREGSVCYGGEGWGGGGLLACRGEGSSMMGGREEKGHIKHKNVLKLKV